MSSNPGHKSFQYEKFSQSQTNGLKSYIKTLMLPKNLKTTLTPSSGGKKPSKTVASCKGPKCRGLLHIAASIKKFE